MSSNKRVCVLDGGGMRGFYAFELLQLLQKNAFDMFVGVSAGAIVATLFACGEITEGKTMTGFQELTREIFQTPSKRGPWFEPKYDGSKKREVLTNYFGTRTLGEARIPLAIVCSFVDGGVTCFCSWKERDALLPLVDVLDATSAAPFYFPPVNVRDMWLIDGGVRANKPLVQAFLLAQELFQTKTQLQFLSIGTYFRSRHRFGKHHTPSAMGIFGWLKHGIFDIFMGTQDNSVEQLFETLFADKFLRLDCMCDDIALDDKRKEAHAILKESAKHTFDAYRQQLTRFFST